MIILCSRMHSLNLHFIFLLSTIRLHVVCCLCFWYKQLVQVLAKGSSKLDWFNCCFVERVDWNYDELVHLVEYIGVYLLDCIGSWKILSDELNSGAAFHYSWNLHGEQQFELVCYCVLIESHIIRERVS